MASGNFSNVPSEFPSVIGHNVTTTQKRKTPSSPFSASTSRPSVARPWAEDDGKIDYIDDAPYPISSYWLNDGYHSSNRVSTTSPQTVLCVSTNSAFHAYVRPTATYDWQTHCTQSAAQSYLEPTIVSTLPPVLASVQLYIPRNGQVYEFALLTSTISMKIQVCTKVEYKAISRTNPPTNAMHAIVSQDASAILVLMSAYVNDEFPVLTRGPDMAVIGYSTTYKVQLHAGPGYAPLWGDQYIDIVETLLRPSVAVKQDTILPVFHGSDVTPVTTDNRILDNIVVTATGSRRGGNAEAVIEISGSTLKVPISVLGRKAFDNQIRVHRNFLFTNDADYLVTITPFANSKQGVVPIEKTATGKMRKHSGKFVVENDASYTITLHGTRATTRPALLSVINHDRIQLKMRDITKPRRDFGLG